jgi:hypothetical protein
MSQLERQPGEFMWTRDGGRATLVDEQRHTDTMNSLVAFGPGNPS